MASPSALREATAARPGSVTLLRGGIGAGPGRIAVRSTVVAALVFAMLGLGIPTASAADRAALKAQAVVYTTEPLPQFLAARQVKPAPYDWTSDGCSTPNVGALSATYNTLFRNACLRHDFGYRNFGQDGLRLDPTESRRQKLDGQLRTDMNGICAKQPITKRPQCLSAANTYYSGVRIFGGPAFFFG
jgi:Prokaryotic phospholipase A2